MAGDCGTSACETGETRGAEERCSSSASKCPCGSACGSDPIECGAAMWTGAFFGAMAAVQRDILKAKIQKAWGAQMDKAADAVLDAMGVQWQSMLAQAKAKGELRERLRSVWQQK